MISNIRSSTQIFLSDSGQRFWKKCVPIYEANMVEIDNHKEYLHQD